MSHRFGKLFKAQILQCSVPNCTKIRQPSNKLRASQISSDLSFGWIAHIATTKENLTYNVFVFGNVGKLDTERPILCNPHTSVQFSVALYQSITGRRTYIWDLTHWGRVTHICVSKLTIIGSDDCLSPYRGQAIIWTNAGLLLIGPLGTNISEILIEILTFSLKKCVWKCRLWNGGHFV